MSNLIADELAKKQREISISEFFVKNRHLLGFDNPRKALLTTIKEGVDNSLDACEEAKILPDIYVKVKQLSEDRFIVTMEDNGPGIVKAQIPRIFGKLLYGSKFHSMKQSRGQQGIGISAAAMYGHLTTGKPTKIISKIGKNNPAHYYELHIDTQKNEPEIVKETVVDWVSEHGTKIEIELEAKYQKGKQGIDDFLQQTAISNPHAEITYISPEEKKIIFKRAADKLPKEPKEIKPHPYGVELGYLIKMMRFTKAKTMQAFFVKEFSRISSKIAKEICDKAGVDVKAHPAEVAKDKAEAVHKAIYMVKIMKPPTNCLSPIGEDLILKGLQKEIKANFYAAATRPPSVYRGNPFQIEVGLAYGGQLEKEELIQLYRFANRAPLQYQQAACAITKSIINTSWRNYGLSQSKGALPVGPIVLFVNISSVWVPFTSESKEAIAHYPEIIKQIKLALQEVGRNLGGYIRKERYAQLEANKVDYIKKYLPHISDALREILVLKEKDEKVIETNLREILEKTRNE